MNPKTRFRPRPAAGKPFSAGGTSRVKTLRIRLAGYYPTLNEAEVDTLANHIEAKGSGVGPWYSTENIRRVLDDAGYTVDKSLDEAGVLSLFSGVTTVLPVNGSKTHVVYLGLFPY